MPNRSINENKKILRKQYIQRRKELTITTWQDKSKHICQHLLNSEIVNQAQVILSYFSFKQEPDLSLLHQQKQFIWGFPRCQGKDLIWHRWQWGDELNLGKYDIPEPLLNAELISPTQVDLILVPAVACDRWGNRLGYGAGYYDRFLSTPESKNISTIGIIFDFAYVAKLATEKWDQPLNYICTEFGLEKIPDSEEQR